MSLPDLSAAERQHNRILRLSFPEGDGPDAILLVNTLDASEGLSRPFEYTLELLSDDAHIHLKDLQGKMLCVALVLADDSTLAAPIDGDPEVPYQRHGGAREENGIGDWRCSATCDLSNRLLPT
jgi:uncharacterized protein involved in type VI secretion and phage assembly